MIHVFMVASKGIPAKYGGFETFVENLTKYKKQEDIKYHVSCMNKDEKHFEYNGADCFNVRVPLKGAPGRIFHVGIVLGRVEKWIKKNNNANDTVIIYILGCRIGPLLYLHSKKLHQLGAFVTCNPDGLEWKRDKWRPTEKKFLHYCEKCLVVNSDLAICDSVNIEKYIRKTYGNKVKNTTFIAYGAFTDPSTCREEKLNDWYRKHGVRENEYYLIVGRFVPENNYATMIREFMKSNSKRDLVIITNVEKNKFYESLLNTYHFDDDKRIKFVGTVYDAELLKKIREEAYGYLHGHSVGGTNPSLLEGLASTRLCLLYNIGFNKEVGKDGAIYWNKDEGDLAGLIDRADKMDEAEIEQLHMKAFNRVKNAYSWNNIVDQYEETWHRLADGELQ